MRQRKQQQLRTTKFGNIGAPQYFQLSSSAEHREDCTLLPFFIFYFFVKVLYVYICSLDIRPGP